ncbi:hypothetical protein SNEBB_005527 [Seison nebaliae]|nr:hypothetical protein SNEBB_005527 [Seison nebaliae]
MSVRAMYDFESEGDPELTIMENEILTIVNEKYPADHLWMEVRNKKGQVGIVPQTYVEKIETRDVNNNMNNLFANLTTTTANDTIETNDLWKKNMSLWTQGTTTNNTNSMMINSYTTDNLHHANTYRHQPNDRLSSLSYGEQMKLSASYETFSKRANNISLNPSNDGNASTNRQESLYNNMNESEQISNFHTNSRNISSNSLRQNRKAIPVHSLFDFTSSSSSTYSNNAVNNIDNTRTSINTNDDFLSVLGHPSAATPSTMSSNSTFQSPPTLQPQPILKPQPILQSQPILKPEPILQPTQLSQTRNSSHNDFVNPAASFGNDLLTPTPVSNHAGSTTNQMNDVGNSYSTLSGFENDIDFPPEFALDSMRNSTTSEPAPAQTARPVTTTQSSYQFNNQQSVVTSKTSTITNIASFLPTSSAHSKKNKAYDTFYQMPPGSPINGEHVTITIKNHDDYCWQYHGPFKRIECNISNPVKESKMKGMKQYTSYHVESTVDGQKTATDRRYKHFLWLHDQLAEKYVTISVPPIPNKALHGNFEEDFIAGRMRQLQFWLDRITAHPVLSQAPVLQHFIKHHDSGNLWKSGKRRAENDPNRALVWINNIQCDTDSIDENDLDLKIKRFMDGSVILDDKLKRICFELDRLMTIFSGDLRKVYSTVGECFEQLGPTINDSTPLIDNTDDLSSAILKIGRIMKHIGTQTEGHAKNELANFRDSLNDYKGVNSNFNHINTLINNISAKGIELSIRNSASASLIKQKIKLLKATMAAEIRYFQNSIVEDLQRMFTTFLDQQIIYHQRITEELTLCRNDFR